MSEQLTKDHLDALLTLIFNATGAAACPVCGGGEWKMSAPPICAACGFRPKPKGAYLALAKEATDRIAALLPPREKAE